MSEMRESDTGHMSEYDPQHDADTTVLHLTPCPGCGFEPEVVVYWRDVVTHRRKGYTCSCGYRIIDGIVAGVNIG